MLWDVRIKENHAVIQAPVIKQIPTIESFPWHAAILSGNYWGACFYFNKAEWNVKLEVFSLSSSLTNVLMRMVTGINDLMSVVV